MKKVLMLLLAALPVIASGCKDDKPTPSVQQQEQGTLPDPEAIDTVPPVEADTVTVDTVATAADKGSDWYGSYSGSLPCGDCKGMLTKLTLTAGNYTLSSQYLGKETKPNVYKGTFYLDKVKDIITLDAEGDHLKFLVMRDENMLRKLDKFGNEEQGAPQSRYLMHKVI